ncbi:MAG: type III-B CRISPR module RAMP protein Cmr4 [Desulfobacca sp.]|uniref:type III-B CRISPR module RAMP protein Cmr4 n=1 Tax=Desulfobacca sp. TaxID=2067990 RepID=UPI00404A2A47
MPRYGFLFINVVTPLHNGSGEGLGAIDRTIMRERTTQFPIVQASSLKGVLRAELELKLANDIHRDLKVKALFGPPPQASGEHAGAVSLGDAMILAFPVRALKGPWVWITSPLILSRLHRQARAAGITLNHLAGILGQLTVATQTAKICPTGANNLLVNSCLLLEEYPYTTQDSPELQNLAGELAGLIYPQDQFLRQEFGKKLVLLSDDDFAYFVTNATEVYPNIRIGDSGTTARGSLRNTEYLPTESVLYSLVTCDAPKKPEGKNDYYNNIEINNAASVHTLFQDNLPDFLQVGADETIGKGLVALQYCTGGGN